MVTCPTCQATLRVPPQAETIRCPQCKTVLTLQPAIAKPPEPTAPAAKPAIPLPFARPPVTVNRESEPEEVQPPLPRGKPKRAQVIEEHEDDGEDEKRKPKKPAPGTDEAKQQAKLERLTAQVKPTCLGLQLLAYGSLAAILAPIGITLYFLSTLYFAGDGNGMAWAPLAGLAVHWVLLFAGFLCCYCGLKDVRNIALTGLIVVVIHISTTIALLFLTNAQIDRATTGFGGINTETGLESSIVYANLYSNLVAVMNMPILIVQTRSSISIPVYAFILFAAGIEFAKLTIVGMLGNHYATDGKSPDLGHQSMRFIYRIFWVVILCMVLQFVILGLAHMGFSFIFLSLPALMIVNAYHLWCIFAWVAEFQVLQDVVEVLTPERLISNQNRLDTYY
jgi:LSD1 subclass zinc finger protein